MTNVGWASHETWMSILCDKFLVFESFFFFHPTSDGESVNIWFEWFSCDTLSSQTQLDRAVSLLSSIFESTKKNKNFYFLLSVVVFSRWIMLNSVWLSLKVKHEGISHFSLFFSISHKLWLWKSLNIFHRLQYMRWICVRETLRILLIYPETQTETHSSILFVFLFFSPFKVSWMRKRDLHILTSNNFLYTGDQRFSVIQPQDTDEWNLKIEYAQPKDAGTYECQVCNYFWFILSFGRVLVPVALSFSLLIYLYDFQTTDDHRPMTDLCQIFFWCKMWKIYWDNFKFFFSLSFCLPSGQHRAENQLCRKFRCRK